MVKPRVSPMLAKNFRQWGNLNALILLGTLFVYIFCPGFCQASILLFGPEADQKSPTHSCCNSPDETPAGTSRSMNSCGDCDQTATLQTLSGISRVSDFGFGFGFGSVYVAGAHESHPRANSDSSGSPAGNLFARLRRFDVSPPPDFPDLAIRTHNSTIQPLSSRFGDGSWDPRPESQG